MTRYKTVLRIAYVTLALCLCSPVSTAAALSAWSEQGTFSVTLTSLSGELAVGDFEEFELAIDDSKGVAVTGATVEFSGGMPGHGHGFPTAPAVTEIGEGLYRLEGVKFSMGGAWEMTLTITVGGTTESVTLNIDI